ncbi:MAG: tellurite resistance TerB family protein [Chloroflexi bacterium]|nr:tellurite resistance TerB family protein [Chloroflexota bacterium]
MNPYTPPAGPFSDEELNAYIETMMLFAVADGTVKNSELNMIQMAVVGYLESHPALKDMKRQQLMDLCFERANAIYADGPHARLQSIAGVLKQTEQRMYALGMAVAVATADGVIQTGERAGFTLLQRAFELTDDQVRSAIKAFG